MELRCSYSKRAGATEDLNEALEVKIKFLVKVYSSIDFLVSFPYILVLFRFSSFSFSNFTVNALTLVLPLSL